MENRPCFSTTRGDRSSLRAASKVPAQYSSRFYRLQPAIGQPKINCLAASPGVSTNTSPHWARWRNAWSISTSASIASAIGVARMPIYRVVAARWSASAPDCRLVVELRSCGMLDVGFECDIGLDVLAGGNAAENAAGLVAAETVGPNISSPHRAALCYRGKAGADFHALGGIDVHHRVGDIGIGGRTPVRPADRYVFSHHADFRADRIARSGSGPCSFELVDYAVVGSEKCIVADVIPWIRTESRFR